MDLFPILAAAGDATSAATASAEKTSSPYSMIPMLIVIMGLFYFLIIRPQKKGQQQTEDMRNAVKAGDKVKSIGGIYGTVTAVDTTNNIVSVQVDKNVKLDFDKNAIATIIKKEDLKQLKEAAK